MSMTFEEKIIDAFQLASAALVKYEKAAAFQETTAQEVAQLAPRAAAELVRFGRIEASEKEACDRALRDPVQALSLLMKLAAHRNAVEDAVLGQQVDAQGRPANGHVKRASENPNYIGQRTGAQPESWRRLAVGLGVA